MLQSDKTPTVRVASNFVLDRDQGGPHCMDARQRPQSWSARDGRWRCWRCIVFGAGHAERLWQRGTLGCGCFSRQVQRTSLTTTSQRCRTGRKDKRPD